VPRRIHVDSSSPGERHVGRYKVYINIAKEQADGRPVLICRVKIAWQVRPQRSLQNYSYETPGRGRRPRMVMYMHHEEGHASKSSCIIHLSAADARALAL
jgi:hypothetical protein